MAEVWKSDQEIIGENVKKARKAAKLTQEQLAEEMGGSCSNKVISRYEKGDSDDEPDEDEPEDIDVDAMIGLIKAKTGLCEKVILAVLAAQEEYLDSIWGENMDEEDKA